jgi:predicted HTH transcriptional regulator
MNSTKGGILLIGIADNGEIKGVEKDYALANKSKNNWDGYHLFLSDLLRNNLDLANPFRFYKVRRYNIEGRDICCINVQPSDEVVYTKNRLFVRDGNRGIELHGRDIVDFATKRAINKVQH